MGDANSAAGEHDVECCAKLSDLLRNDVNLVAYHDDPFQPNTQRAEGAR
jgi:hypothetical protein